MRHLTQCRFGLVALGPWLIIPAALAPTAGARAANPACACHSDTRPIGGGGVASSIAVADLNGDGRPDLVVANRETDALSVLLGVGDGAFVPQPSVPVGNRPHALALGDLNNDGAVDAAVVNFLSDDLSIVFGVGDGSFAPEVRLPVGEGPTSVAIGRIDPDPFPDLMVALFQSTGDSVERFFNAGDGTGVFTQAPFSVPPAKALAVVIADLDGDLVNDAVVGASGGLSFLTTTCPPPNPCPADVNADAIVNGADLASLLNQWGRESACRRADLNGDGVVNGADLAGLLNAFGPCP